VNGLTIGELDDLADAEAIEAAYLRWAAARARRRRSRARLRWFKPWPLAVVDWPRSIPGGGS